MSLSHQHDISKEFSISIALIELKDIHRVYGDGKTEIRVLKVVAHNAG